MQPSFVLLEHNDHVTALAAAPAAGLLASGGLSSELFLWDITAAVQLKPPAVRHGKAVPSSTFMSGLRGARFPAAKKGACAVCFTAGGVPSQEYHPIEALGLKESVYSVALNADGNVVASGSPEACVRITDPRANRKIMKLRGHTANIRCLPLTNLYRPTLKQQL